MIKRELVVKNPAYADAFARFEKYCRKLTDQDALNEQDKEQFDKAVADLMLLEFCNKFDVDPADL